MLDHILLQQPGLPLFADVGYRYAIDVPLRAGRIIHHLRESATHGTAEMKTESLRSVIEEASALALAGSREKGIKAVLDYRAAGIKSVVWCIGFRTDYGWIDLPLFNGRGQPRHVRGVSPVPGVYFLGLPWLYTWGSGRFSGVARDAEYVAQHIKARIGLPGERGFGAVNEAAIGS